MRLQNSITPALSARARTDGTTVAAGGRLHLTLTLKPRDPAALAAYAAARPAAWPKDLVTAMQTDEVFRIPAIEVAEGRVANGGPTWMYWFTWATPAFGGALGACHAVDIAFVFHNLAAMGVEQFTGDGADRVAVSDAYSAAVLAFARDEDPGWPQYDLDRRATQRIDVVSETVDDPEGELRRLWARA